jgi:hypothetical protein
MGSGMIANSALPDEMRIMIFIALASSSDGSRVTEVFFPARPHKPPRSEAVFHSTACSHRPSAERFLHDHRRRDIRGADYVSLISLHIRMSGGRR